MRRAAPEAELPDRFGELEGVSRPFVKKSRILTKRHWLEKLQVLRNGGRDYGDSRSPCSRGAYICLLSEGKPAAFQHRGIRKICGLRGDRLDGHLAISLGTVTQ